MAKQQPADPHPLLFPSGQAVSFDPEAFDDLVRSQGVEFQYFRAVACPVGLVDPNDERRPHPDHSGCSNGFLYIPSGTVTAAFLGNQQQLQFFDAGRVPGSTAHVVLPRFLDKSSVTEPDVALEPAVFDRLYLSDEKVTVVHWERFAASDTGVDRLHYPIVGVRDLVDSSNRRWVQGVDFDVQGGDVHWRSGGPGRDPKTGKGRVCSARYVYRPYWYIQALPHEVRVAQRENAFGVRETLRFNHFAVIQREYMFRNADNDPESSKPNDPRQALAPEPWDGRFGPRG